MRDVEKYKNMPVERQILFNLAKRRRWAHRDYLSVKEIDPNDRENRVITMLLWTQARNTYIAAKEIVANN